MGLRHMSCNIHNAATLFERTEWGQTKLNWPVYSGICFVHRKLSKTLSLVLNCTDIHDDTHIQWPPLLPYGSIFSHYISPLIYLLSILYHMTDTVSSPHVTTRVCTIFSQAERGSLPVAVHVGVWGRLGKEAEIRGRAAAPGTLPFLSTPKHTTAGWPDPSSLLMSRHSSIHTMAHKYEY